MTLSSRIKNINNDSSGLIKRFRYLEKDAHGQGIGRALYDKLLRLLAEMNIRAVIGGIALPNTASVELHEKFGF